MVGVEPMYNACSKCARRYLTINLRPKNVNYSSKAMEAIGSASIIAENLFLDYNAYIYEYVGNDDSSTKKC